MNPIIQEIINTISKNKNAIKFTNKKEFKTFLNNQKYFSASYSHCFQSENDFNDFLNGKNTTDNESILLKNCGNIVAIWNNKKSIGFIIPSN